MSLPMYTNPIQKHGDFADPFVLRYNGRYYLYCTNPHVLCWSGDDLVHWQPEGAVIPEDEFPDTVPFAPEVVYENGSFYMYTSPHGFGHYVLQSKSPLGPFRKITPNVGHSIDFSVFLDEDGKRYAYWADDAGILGCEMPTPTTFGSSQLIGAYLHGWTEGPFVVKRNGLYHLTYTGNHYLSKGYRIHEAVSAHPLGPYEDNPYNPIVVRAEGNGVGLGHSCTITAPDLCSDYIVYHNLNPDHSRDLNIDQVLFAGTQSYVLGPTTQPHPLPRKPSFADLVDGHVLRPWKLIVGGWHAQRGMRVSEGDTFACQCQWPLPQRGVAECNLFSDATRYGIRLVKDDNELLVHFNRVQEMLLLEENGATIYTMKLPKDFCHDALHCIRLSFDSQLTIHLDHLRVTRIPWDTAGASLGYWAREGCLHMGYTAISNVEDGAPVFPLPATMPPLHQFAFQAPNQGEYTVLLEKDIPVAALLNGCAIPIERINQGDSLSTLTLLLPKGQHVLSLEGGLAAAIYPAPVAGNDLLHVQSFGPYNKRCAETIYDDVACEAELILDDYDTGWQAGFLLRALELADGGEDNDPVLGRNFFIGYRVTLGEDGLSLWKHRYDEQCIVTVPVSLKKRHALRIHMHLNEIQVWLDDEKSIQWADAQPILFGRIGIQARNCILPSATISAKTLPKG